MWVRLMGGQVVGSKEVKELRGQGECKVTTNDNKYNSRENSWEPEAEMAYE